MGNFIESLVWDMVINLFFKGWCKYFKILWLNFVNLFKNNIFLWDKDIFFGCGKFFLLIKEGFDVEWWGLWNGRLFIKFFLFFNNLVIE